MLNYEHLFDHVDELMARLPQGPPRQITLRRAVSGAYYGLFHFALTRAADHAIGVTKRTTKQYVLAYRSVDHRTLREVSVEVKKPTPSARYARYVPTGGWGSNLQAFAAAAVDLQEERLSADYDPGFSLSASDARLAIQTARTAISRFGGASSARKGAFLSLLLFPPR